MKQVSYLFFLASAVLLVIGFVVAYHYGGYNSDYPRLYDSAWDKMGHVVGGDAYNYIIMATRGVLFGVSSLIFAVVGSVLYIVSTLTMQKHEEQPLVNYNEQEQILMR